MKRTFSIVATVSIASIFLLSACGGGKSSSQADCEDLVAKMRSCDLMSRGEVNCDIFGSDPETLCNIACITKASCGEVEDLVCRDEVSSSMQACYLDCSQRYQFTCADGSDSISSYWVCDGDEDCDDGSDEEGCPVFACEDGSGVIDPSWVCDMEADCQDGSDEYGCEFFGCNNGLEVYPLSYVCDMEEDCEDGSDEFGCASIICP